MSKSQARVDSFYDADTSTYSHVLADEASGQCAVIDPVLRFEPHAGQLSTAPADALIAHIRVQGWQLQWILETHVHADHLSGAQHVKAQLGGRVAMGEGIREVQAIFRTVFDFEPGFVADGSQFDQLFRDGEQFQLGGLQLQAWWVPGHTPADMAYIVGDLVFVGDTLFMPDVGTARADFPGGDAAQLYRSIQRILALPPHTQLLMCHDYPPERRAPQPRSTVAEQKAHNIHVHDGVDEASFVALREKRDATLAVPRLILPSIQVNVRAGHLPPAAGNGQRYLQLPINVLGAGQK